MLKTPASFANKGCKHGLAANSGGISQTHTLQTKHGVALSMQRLRGFEPYKTLFKITVHLGAALTLRWGCNPPGLIYLSARLFRPVGESQGAWPTCAVLLSTQLQPHRSTMRRSQNVLLLGIGLLIAVLLAGICAAADSKTSAAPTFQLAQSWFLRPSNYRFAANVNSISPRTM
jgi:hypothetical protein